MLRILFAMALQFLPYQTVETTQGPIAYVDTGGSGFPIVLIHGNSCSSEVFTKQIAAFRDRYRMISIDLPGHGRSSRPYDSNVAYSLPGYANVIDEVICHLGLDQFVVLGFSLGGNIALQLTEFSDRIKAIMMIASAPIKYSDEAFLAYPPYEGGYGAYPGQLTEVQARQYNETVGFQVDDPSVRFMIDDAMKTDGQARGTMVTSILAGKGVDETEIVGRLTIPLAIVVGADDFVLGLNYMKSLHYQNLWHGKLEFIPQAQHAIIFHQADVLNPLIQSFLRDFAH